MASKKFIILLITLWILFCIPPALVLAYWAVDTYDLAMNSSIGLMAANGGGMFNARNQFAEWQRNKLLLSALYTLGCMVLLTLPLTVAVVARIRRRKGPKSEATLDTRTGNTLAAAPNRRALQLKISGIAALLLSGCLGYYWFGGYSRMAEAKERVSEVLSDPDSAKFREVRTVRDAVCGQVNAKNKLGGYVGYREFAYFNGSVFIDSGSDDGISMDSNLQVSRICRE